jgi:Caspase domain
MKRFLVPVLCCMLLLCFSCSSNKPKPTTAESKVTYTSLKLGLPSSVKGTVVQSSVFLTSDEAIVALVELDDLMEPIEVRWDWIAPNEKVYVSASRKVGPSEGKYYPKVALSHAMNVDREVASTRPGIWSVEVYIDGTLKEGRRFPIEPGLATLRSREVPADPKKWALVVGIEKYSHLPQVEFAAYDARTVVNYFINLLGIPEKNVILLENEKATLSAVAAKLKDYFPNNLGKDSTLYVYFAGHGMPDVATGAPYLMLFDSEATNVSRTGYPIKELLADLGALKIKNAFLFTDACFSGMAARGDKMLVPGARPAVIRVDDVNLTAGKMVAMGASTGNQLSQVYRDKRHGLFTYYLLDGLKRQVDSKQKGGVTFGELYPYVKENVEQVSRRTTMEQVPSITPGIEKVADISLGVVSKGAK